MNINIKRQKLDELELFLKENEIKPASTKFGYDWDIKGETTDESIEDFHLFCISIVKDLITNEFITNEEGKISYDFFCGSSDEEFNEEDEDECEDEDEEYEEITHAEYLLESLHFLFDTIARRKIDNESSGR